MIQPAAAAPAGSVFDIHSWFLANTTQRDAFLARHGWTIQSEFKRDAALRRAFRVEKGVQTAVFQESLPDDHPFATVGHAQKDFIRLSDALRTLGFSTPEIYAAELESGFLIVEDFGSESLGHQLDAGASPVETYRNCIDILAESVRICDTLSQSLKSFGQSHIGPGYRRYVDWWLPLLTGDATSDAQIESFLSAWQAIFDALPPAPQGFLFVDFVPFNLMHLPERTGIHATGILDFQGALRGPVPFDFVNLMYDARRSIAPEVRAEILHYYLDSLPSAMRADCAAWIPVLKMHFHMRVIGQFIRLALKIGNPGYLQYLPRLHRYIHEGLEEHTALEPLKKWHQDWNIDPAADVQIDPVERISSLIRPDAH